MLQETSMILETSDKTAIRQLIKANRKTPFYVYLLIRPDKDEPFYVGKGKSDRIFQHEKEVYKDTANSYKSNIITKILSQGLSLIYTIESFYQFEEDALNREMQLIEEIGRKDLGKGTLTNLTAGGEGFLDWINFEKHSTTGRVLRSNSGNLDVMMNKGKGAKKHELLIYLENDGWTDSDPVTKEEWPEKLSSEYLWIGRNFYERLRQGYGREEYLAEYLKQGDLALRKVKLIQNYGDTYYRREDEFSCIIERLIHSESWISKNTLMDLVKVDLRERKEIDEAFSVQVIEQLLKELADLKKIAHEGNQYRWLDRDNFLIVSAQGRRPSEILSELYAFSKGNRNICVSFLGADDKALAYLTLFPHHFRRSVLKTYFRQKVALMINVTKADSLKVYKL